MSSSSWRAARSLCVGLSISAWACPAVDRPASPPAAAPAANAEPGTGRREADLTGAPDGAVGAVEACVDARLAARALNALGDPPGTVYGGGTPLFDEAARGDSGAHLSRVCWVLVHRPEIAAECGPTGSSPDRRGDR